MAYYVNPSITGGDGTTPATAFDSLNDVTAITRDLVTETATDDVYCLNATNTTADPNWAWFVTNWTTNATYFLTVHQDSANRHDGVWDTSKYHLSGTATSMLRPSEGMVIDGLQVENTESGRSPIGSGNTYVDVTIQNCLVRGAFSATGAQIGLNFQDSGNQNVKLFNNIVYGVDGVGYALYARGSSGANTIVANNTFLSAGTLNNGMRARGGFVELVNNAVFGVDTTPITLGEDVSESGYNAAEVAGSSNFGGAAGGLQNNVDISSDAVTDHWTSATDANPVAGSSLLTAGIGTSNAIVPSTDAFGNARGSSTCTIGAIEFVSSASTEAPVQGGVRFKGYEVVHSAIKTKAASQGLLQLRGYAPTETGISGATTKAALRGLLSLKGYALTERAIKAKSVIKGLLNLKGYAPTETVHRTEALATGSIQFRGYAPSKTSITGSTKAALRGSISFRGYTPTESATKTKAISRGNIALHGNLIITTSGGILTKTLVTGKFILRGYTPAAYVYEWSAVARQTTSWSAVAATTSSWSGISKASNTWTKLR